MCLTANFYILNDIAVNKDVLAFVFFSTLFSYNFQRLVKIKFKINLKGERVEWIKINKTGIYVITAIAFIGSLFYGLSLLKNSWWLLFVIGLLTFFYVWKIPGLKGKSLRDIPTLKIFIIALVWVLFCVEFPALVAGEFKFNQTLILYSISVLFFMIALTIPFDVRDMDNDVQSKKTIPQLFGEVNAKYLSLVLLIISQAILLYIYPKFMIGIIVFTLISAFVLSQSKKRNKELYFSGLVDGLLVLQMVVLWGGVFLFHF